MKREDLILQVILCAGIIGVIIWVRFNLDLFQPILENSLLFFQLILAATIIAVLRNIIGVRTFGVFGPTIIAFGILEAGLFWGLALYIDVFIVAMLTSLALYPLALASTHRIAIVITITAITITFIELVGEIYHMGILESTLLFPVLITSWLADRYVKRVKEIDWLDPSKRLLGTVFAVIIAYFIINIKSLILFIALNPEIWAIFIILNIAMALKVNFRLSEHLRFKPINDSGIKKEDVLGLNKRNRGYIFKYNPSNLYPHITKDKMKITFHQLGVPTPATYSIVQDKKDLPFAENVMRKEKSFVIKPSSGLGGEGILVVKKIKKAGKEIYYAKDKEYSLNQLKNHIVQILDGQYSSEWTDVAIIEQKVEPDPELLKYSFGGVPDIRVIVFEGFPIMAMTRLPTKESEGTANIHKGAIAMGLSIANGNGVNPYWRGHGGKLEQHPDTGEVLKTLKIKNWTQVLVISSLAQIASRLGYVGVDIVFDKSGPMVLEVNKRPGLEIQNTNLAGLLKRIEFVEKQLHEKRFLLAHDKVKLSQKWDKEGWK